MQALPRGLRDLSSVLVLGRAGPLTRQPLGSSLDRATQPQQALELRADRCRMHPASMHHRHEDFDANWLRALHQGRVDVVHLASTCQESNQEHALCQSDRQNVPQPCCCALVLETSCLHMIPIPPLNSHLGPEHCSMCGRLPMGGTELHKLVQCCHSSYLLLVSMCISMFAAGISANQIVYIRWVCLHGWRRRKNTLPFIQLAGFLWKLQPPLGTLWDPLPGLAPLSLPLEHHQLGLTQAQQDQKRHTMRFCSTLACALLVVW